MCACSLASWLAGWLACKKPRAQAGAACRPAVARAREGKRAPISSSSSSSSSKVIHDAVCRMLDAVASDALRAYAVGMRAALECRHQRMQLLRSSQGPGHSTLRPGAAAAHGQRHRSQARVVSDAEAGLGGEAGEGWGRGELEDRVRILLGVLERERRGREEERQKMCELEVALEEAQVRRVGCAGIWMGGLGPPSQCGSPATLRGEASSARHWRPSCFVHLCRTGQKADEGHLCGKPRCSRCLGLQTGGTRRCSGVMEQRGARGSVWQQVRSTAT